MKRLIQLTGALLLLACAPTASAQTDGTFAVGVNVSVKDGADSLSIGNSNVGFLWRFGHGHDGWGFHYGLGWYGIDLDRVVGNERTTFGSLRVRPFMGGYGYSKRLGRRTYVSAKVLSGYAFTSFDLRQSFGDTYLKILDAHGVSADISNTFVVKPEVSAWVDLTRSIGLNVSAGYMVARPHVTVSSSLGEDRRGINADALMLKIGLAYSVF